MIDLIKNIKKRYVVLSVLLILFLLFAIVSPYGFVNRFRLESEKAEIINNLRQERKVEDSLRAYIRRLENDNIEIERLAREKYGMVKPGEKVYKLKKSNDNTEKK